MQASSMSVEQSHSALQQFFDVLWLKPPPLGVDSTTSLHHLGFLCRFGPCHRQRTLVSMHALGNRRLLHIFSRRRLQWQCCWAPKQMPIQLTLSAEGREKRGPLCVKFGKGYSK